MTKYKMPTKKKRANQPDEQEKMELEHNPVDSSDSSGDDDEDDMPDAYDGNEVSIQRKTRILS